MVHVHKKLSLIALLFKTMPGYYFLSFLQNFVINTWNALFCKTLPRYRSADTHSFHACADVLCENIKHEDEFERWWFAAGLSPEIASCRDGLAFLPKEWYGYSIRGFESNIQCLGWETDTLTLSCHRQDKFYPPWYIEFI